MPKNGHLTFLGISKAAGIFLKERSSKSAIYFHSEHSTYLDIKHSTGAAVEVSVIKV